MLLGIVIINYRSEKMTIEYIHNELPKISTFRKVVIVNNGGTMESDSILAENIGGQLLISADDNIDSSQDVFILGSQKNYGFARGNNLGADFLKRHFPLTHILFSNVDLAFQDEDVVEKLIHEMDSRPDVGAIGPCVQGLDGKDQSPGRYVSVWKSQILPMILFPLIKILNCFQLWRGEIVPNASSGYYNRIIGAFLLVRADIFFLARGFDPKTFLYAEELIYNERIKKLGYKSYYFRDVRIIHECGAIISLTCSTSRTEIFFRESMLYYYTRYVGMSRLDRFMYDVAAMVYHCLWLPIIKIKRYIKSVK